MKFTRESPCKIWSVAKNWPDESHYVVILVAKGQLPAGTRALVVQSLLGFACEQTVHVLSKTIMLSAHKNIFVVYWVKFLKSFRKCMYL